jgi:hypothetical protein
MTVRIPSPCHEDWNRMTPNERGRHCAACDKTVVDVTRMGPRGGGEYLRRLPAELAAGAKVCVHAHADARGRLLSPAQRRLLTNGLAAVLAVAIAGCTGNGPQVAGHQPQPAPQHQQDPPPGPVLQAIDGDVLAPVPGGVQAGPELAPMRGDVCEVPAVKGKPAAAEPVELPARQ